MASEPSVRMHAWQIEPREYARQEERRGRRHAFQRLAPARTALVVIDMVPFFLSQSAYCRGIVPNIVSLADGLRAAGVGRVGSAGAEQRHPALGHGILRCRDRRIVSNVRRRWPACRRVFGLPSRRMPDDLIVEKSGFSAFFPGNCPLPALLEERAIDTVLITGTVTNICCESSARDAHSSGFRVVMVADANAARRDQDHNATLHNIYRSFGDVGRRPRFLMIDGEPVARGA